MHRLEHSRLFAGDVASMAFKHFQFYVEAAPKHILAEQSLFFCLLSQGFLQILPLVMGTDVFDIDKRSLCSAL